MKMKNTKRSMLLSALSLLLCVSMFVGTTYAWFTDGFHNSVNKIVSGNLDVELYHMSYSDAAEASDWSVGFGIPQNVTGNKVAPDTKLFLNEDGEEMLWEPGAASVENFRIKNEGSLALKYQFTIATSNATETPEGKTLADIIDIVADEIKYQDNGVPTGTTILSAQKLGDGYVFEGYLLPGEEYNFWVGLEWVPSDIDNDFNVEGGLTIDLGVTLLATQQTYEKDDYQGDQYDANAQYPDIREIIFRDGGETVLGVYDKQVVVTSKNVMVTMSDGKINYNGRGFTNEGLATLNNIEVTAGTAAAYAMVATGADSVTTLNNVDLASAGGGVGINDGATVVFNSGDVAVNTTSTSGRYLFYLEGKGSNLTINDGNFADFTKTSQNQKRAYIYAGEGTSVTINGGIFGKASTRSGYTDGILGTGEVIIKGGTFGFDPTKWVADGYKVAESKGVYYVMEESTEAVETPDELKAAFATGGNVLLIVDIKFEKMTAVEPGAEVYMDLNGKTITVDESTTSNTLIWVKDGAKLTIDGNGTIDLGSVSTMAIFCPYGELVIENGTFIRDKVTTVTNATTGLFMGAKSSDCNVTINGGYFDAGYYDENAANIEDILAGKATLTETADDIAKRGKPGDANLVRVAVKDNVSVVLNHSGYGSFKVYGGTFVGANPAWGDEGCMLPTTSNYLRPWSYYQGALLAGQTYNENGIVVPDGYTITQGATADGVPTYTVTYNK